MLGFQAREGLISRGQLFGKIIEYIKRATETDTSRLKLNINIKHSIFQISYSLNEGVDKGIGLLLPPAPCFPERSNPVL